MKITFGLALIASGMISTTAFCSELGLILDKQFGKSVSAGYGEFTAFSPTGFGIRGAYTVLDLKAVEFGLAASYHPKSQSDFTWVNSPEIKAKSEYMSIGAQADWKLIANLHAGIEIRREKISTDVHMTAFQPPSSLLLDAYGGNTSFTRPWINAGIGFSIPAPAIQPFIRLEAAYALKTYSLPTINANGDDLRKAIAPRYQIALYGGIRF
jgi:hypothetical protein